MGQIVFGWVLNKGENNLFVGDNSNKGGINSLMPQDYKYCGAGRKKKLRK
jgi:hypothetical protein